jgi:hypothetical protein
VHILIKRELRGMLELEQYKVELEGLEKVIDEMGASL